MSLNLTYICIFVITSRKDCILVNSMVQCIFIYHTIVQPGKHMETYS